MSTDMMLVRAMSLDAVRPCPTLAASITRGASTQTYYTILLLADRDRVAGAYRAYAYFRWLDDTLDGDGLDERARRAFVRRQQTLVDRLYGGERPAGLAREEWLLADLVRADGGQSAGLETYIRDMMAVMAFDSARRGRLVSAAALSQYTRWLATAVTEAMHHFIGHDAASPRHPAGARIAAVTGAHITHMLRDTLDDAAAGYFNIPRELVEAQGIDPLDVTGEAYRAWVRGRVRQARALFQQGRDYFAWVQSARCRLAAYAYTARFECILDLIERDGYVLRAAYPERKSLPAALRIAGASISQTVAPRHPLPGRALSYR